MCDGGQPPVTQILRLPGFCHDISSVPFLFSFAVVFHSKSQMSCQFTFPCFSTCSKEKKNLLFQERGVTERPSGKWWVPSRRRVWSPQSRAGWGWLCVSGLRLTGPARSLCHLENHFRSDPSLIFGDSGLGGLGLETFMSVIMSVVFVFRFLYVRAPNTVPTADMLSG